MNYKVLARIRKEKKFSRDGKILTRMSCFTVVFYDKLLQVRALQKPELRARGARWRFPAGMKDAMAEEKAPEAALAVSCLPGVTPQKRMQPLTDLQLRCKDWIKCTQQD